MHTAQLAIRPRDWLLLYLLSLSWGSSFLFYEYGLSSLPPLTIVAIRMLIGTAVMFVLMRDRIKYLIQVRTRWVRCIAYGFLGAAVPYTLFAFAQIHITSSLASVLNSTMPLFTFLCATIVGQEHFSVKRLCGMILGIIGVIFLVGPSFAGNIAEAVGSLLCLAAAVCYGINTVTMRARPGGMEPAALALGLCAGATVVSCIAAAAVEGPTAILSASWQALVAATALGVIGTALAYRIFFHLLAQVGASNTALGVLLIPVNAVPLGVILLGEQLQLSFFIGTAIILLSLILVDKGIGDSIVRILGRKHKA